MARDPTEPVPTPAQMLKLFFAHPVMRLDMFSKTCSPGVDGVERQTELVREMIDKVNKLMPNVYRLVLQELPDYYWLQGSDDPFDEAAYVVLTSTNTVDPIIFSNVLGIGQKERGVFISSLIARLKKDGPLAETQLNNLRTSAKISRAVMDTVIKTLKQHHYLGQDPNSFRLILGPRALAELATPHDPVCTFCDKPVSIFATCDCGKLYHYKCVVEMQRRGLICVGCSEPGSIERCLADAPNAAISHLQG
ncbi:Non-structural maintenance of chromosomes element 1 NSE1 [Carpediemonas membranifera]|uniref:Non-structural maintenance of chromosomes element 1 NSE1 n=1 Tax=Carpediemonas membranifera TaxID=201153 RepID=A0A8J6BXV2_9EUKA|nr:Non-structural maintenance of chromosomes element 1 NSE1 [Carpediemonas membranifera]|eukprot:KAG9393861.1 Non-structural maintenance of chromosomes element 1 NSE1 [Carpediemonas membranifera]